MTEIDRRTWATGLALVCILAGVLPFLPVLGWLPWGADASKWIAWTALDGTWWDSVTGRKHFVGYRPVAAFSYVLNHLTTGHSPLGYRGLDLALHGLSGALLALLVGQWSLPRGPGLDRTTALVGLFVVLVLFGHPATEEVVPYSARRSYLLSMCFGIGGLLLFGAALRWSGQVRSGAGFLGSAGLLGLAVLSNESAYVLVPLVPLVGLHLTWSAPRIRRIALGLLPLLGVTLAAIGLRVTVLGSLSGGYHRRYFATLNVKGRPAWVELDAWHPMRILDATWSYLLVPHETSGARLVTSGGVQNVLVFAGVAFLLAMVAVCVRNRHDPVARSGLLAVAWLLGSTAIIVLSQTWFWRQAYWLLPPYGMLLAIAVREATLRWSDDRARALRFGVPAAALLLLSLVHGPVLRLGMNRGVHLDKAEGSRITLAVNEAIDDLVVPTDVALVVPLKGSRSHLVRLWQRHLHAGSGHRFRLLAHLDRGVRTGSPDPRLERDGDVLVLSGGYWLSNGYTAASTDPDPALPGSRPTLRLELAALRRPARPVTIVGVDPSPLRIDLPAKPLTPKRSPARTTTPPSPLRPERR